MNLSEETKAIREGLDVAMRAASSDVDRIIQVLLVRAILVVADRLEELDRDYNRVQRGRREAP